MRIKSILITLVAMLCMAAFSFPVSANVPASETAKAEEASVNDSTQSKTPLTPKGNLTKVDDVHQVTDEDIIEDKQFITVQSKNGNTFYIIIDRSGDTENVYFLNAVDEADLMALTEEGKKEQLPAACTCTDKCEVGKVNEKCAVCSKDKDKCIGKAVEATPKPEEKPSEKRQNNSSPLVILVIFALIGAGGAFYWFKIKNNKSSTKGDTDPNDIYEEDEDYEVEEEPETETDEADYEVENGDEDTVTDDTGNDESEVEEE